MFGERATRAGGALALLALLAVLGAARAQHSPAYLTTVKKGVAGAVLTEHPPAYIPANQCSGVEQEFSCSNPVALEVSVTDFAPYPKVEIDNSLTRAVIERQPPCAGEAAVTIRAACPAMPRSEPAGHAVPLQLANQPPYTNT